jgi:hypothetical protein
MVKVNTGCNYKKNINGAAGSRVNMCLTVYICDYLSINIDSFMHDDVNGKCYCRQKALDVLFCLVYLQND